MTLDSRVILVLFDLSAAFDTIDHEILVSRLQTRFGIQSSALQLLLFYLVELYQIISVGKHPILCVSSMKSHRG